MTAADRQRRARLEALGIELLLLRESLATDEVAGSHPGTPVGESAPTPVRLVLLVQGGADALRGEHGARVGALLAALGVGRDEVGFEFDASLPSLALGPHPEAAHAALQAPAPASLRDARSKRALWPALRALRRRLQPVSE